MADEPYFNDVDASNVFFDDIQWTYERGQFDGDESGNFRPWDPMLRAHEAKLQRNMAEMIDAEFGTSLAERIGGETPPPADTTPPVIVLKGDNPMSVIQGSAYVEPGWTVTDETDPNPTVEVFGTVDVGTPGSYELEYQATDSSGNYSMALRTVVVEAFVPPPIGDFDVVLEPGDNLQQKIDAAGENAKIGVAPGQFDNASVTARAGQYFELVDASVATEWNGRGRSFGMKGPSVEGVVIRGHKMWTLRNYNTPKYRGVIDTFSSGDWYNNPDITDNGWDIDGVIVRDANYGVTLFGHNARLTNFELHNIGTLGFSMRFHADMYVGQGILRHIGHDNMHSGGWGHEGGGSKSWETLRLVHEDIDIEDSDGPGLWTDHGNHDTVYRRITARNTRIAAIFHEISGSSLIEDCTIENLPGNGDDSVWSRGGQGINIANAQAEIRNCTLRNMETGIGFIDHSRGGWTGTCAGEVHHVTLDNAGRSGAAGNGTQGRVDWDFNTIDLLNGSWID